VKEDYLYWLGFSAFQGIGPKRFALLKNYFRSAKKAWQAPLEGFRNLGLSGNLVENFSKFRSNFNPSSYCLRLRENKIGCLFLDDKNYPKNLKNTDNPPFILYVKGKIETKDEKAIAIVGTRKMTGYGGQVTESLAVDLVSANLTIVSGLARGIDTIAHRTTLSAGGRTIAVLGSGLDVIYPPENRSLVDTIINGHGAVVSEYPLGTLPLAGNFPSRNRIIAGLSLGTVVIEGSEKSGALITARLAVEQGREVFAVPGPITSPNSAGPAHLIKMGAKLVFSAEDILEELKIEPGYKIQEAREISPENQEEETILLLLKNEPKHLDQLVRETGFPAPKLISLISLMEIKGKVKDLGGGVYAIVKS
jgi:DNA processing protein